jgi:hypothetical protein
VNGIAAYLEARRARIPPFVATHFSWPGALKLNRKALGRDLYRAPLNILWSAPALAAVGSAKLLARLGERRLSTALARVPAGLETDVQKEVAWLIYTEFLELPYAQPGRMSHKDALLGAILEQPELAGRVGEYLDEIRSRSSAPGFRAALERDLGAYAGTRTAAADMAASLINLAAGYAAFQKLTPGAMATGSAAAAAIANQIAIGQFWLGPSLGAWYYGWFPATASTGLLVASTGTVMLILALASSVAGMVTDPLQARLGLHQRRLHKLIDALEAELTGTGSTPLRLADRYLARVFDLLDLLRMAAGSRR